MKGTLRIFLHVLLWRPQRALAIGYWYATRRRVRARGRLRTAAAQAPFAYAAMVGMMEDTATVTAAAPALVAGWAVQPLFSIIALAPDRADRRWCARVIRDVRRQCYDHWELIVVGGIDDRGDDQRIRCLPPGTSFAQATEEARGTHFVAVAPGVTLARTALFRFAEALQVAPEATLLYGDEDRIDRFGRRSRPWLKPGWNGELIFAMDYVSRACALAADAARAALAPLQRDPPTPYRLVLAMTSDASARVVHVPHVVAHLRRPDDDQIDRVAAVAATLRGAGAHAETGPFGTVSVRWPLPEDPPHVAILVPTRDRLELLRPCIDGLLAQTTYARYSVCIIDNGSAEPATLAYLEAVVRDPRVRVLRCDLPYNFSAINNFAVARIQSDYLCFLNNDTEIIGGDWLSELMRYAVRPGIGAVGAKLLYADRSIQHAGVVMGLGNAAGHAHRALPDGAPGYFAQAHAAHYASAVTAACLVVEKSKFLAVGGFDAEGLAIAYNDVDLCMKLGRAGWRNVYAPRAVLLHLENTSRGLDLSREHIARYTRELAVLQARWGTTTIVDPMHHPRLDRASETYRLSLLMPHGNAPAMSNTTADPPLSATLLPGVPLVESPLFALSLDAMGLSEAERAIAVQLHTRGYAVLDFPDADLDARIARIMENLAPRFDVDISDRSRPVPGNLRLQDAWSYDADVKAIAANPGIVALLSKLYGRRAFPFQTLNFPVGTEQHAHADAVHFSSQPERFMCGVWLALEDITAEAGPLLYYPGSHTWPIVSNAMIGRRGWGTDRRSAQAPFEAVWRAMVAAEGAVAETFLPRKGQALIWAANLLHGGSGRSDPRQTRWSQVTHYYFADCAYYTPAFSDEPLGRLDLRTITNIATGEIEPNCLCGEILTPTRPPRAAARRRGWRQWFGMPRAATDLPADFAPDTYLALNPDVATAGDDPAVHFRAHGRAEGRRYR